MTFLSDNHTISVRQSEEGFQQTLKFSYQKEYIFINGIKSLYAFSRRVQIRYVGLREGVYKFQLGVLKSEFSLSRMANTTAELSKSLHRALGLLVVGADIHSNLVKVYNLPFVQYRWDELKKEFLQDYDQEKYLTLIHEMDQHIANEHALIAYLKLPTMYGLYFNGYWEIKDENKKPIQYGKELSEMQITEIQTYSIKRNESQQETTIIADLHSPNNDIHIQYYKSTCTYVDGILHTCKKEIQIDSTKFYYSAKWVGLKKLFQ